MLKKIGSACRVGDVVLMGALCALGFAAAPVLAAQYRFGVNAEVSYKESEAEVRQRYTPFLQELGKLTGHQFGFYPVYSDRVAQAVANQRYDFLLIHTHAALKAEKEHQFRVVGFTEDRKNNQVFFFVKPDSAIQALADVAQARIGVPGLQSWATATARAELQTKAVTNEPQFVSTRYQEAVPLMLELRTAQVGVTRSKKLVDDNLRKQKLRVVHVTDPLPLSAVIAAPNVPAATVDALRGALMIMGQSNAFDALSFTSLTYSAEQRQSLHQFYQ